MDITIDGKRVTLRDRLTLAGGYDILDLVNKSDARDLRTSLPLLERMVESWEFDGDPADAGSYEALDILAVWQMIREAHAQVNKILTPGEPEKN